MKKEPKFFVCKHCGNVVTFVNESGAPLSCCGSVMEQIVPNTVDAATEKHLPVVSVEGNVVKVKVGTVEHPMTEEHLIQWIFLETDKGLQMKYLAATDKPEAVFVLDGDTPKSVYEHCNLHGLWKTVI